MYSITGKDMYARERMTIEKFSDYSYVYTKLNFCKLIGRIRCINNFLFVAVVKGEYGDANSSVGWYGIEITFRFW